MKVILFYLKVLELLIGVLVMVILLAYSIVFRNPTLVLFAVKLGVAL